MKKRVCKFCNAAIPPCQYNLASQKNASTSISAMAYARYWPPSWCRRDSSCGIWAKPAPAQIGPHIWPTSYANCPLCSATIGWSIISIPTGASRSAVSWPNGVPVPFIPKALHRGAQRRAFLCDPTHKHVFHFTPKHGSWLNQVELWFSVLARRFLKRGDFDSAHDFETRLSDYLEVYNTHHAHPYRWTYTGQPLVRATPFSRTRRQQRHGRAWFSARPQRFERVFYPPRPYKRATARLAANL